MARAGISDSEFNMWRAVFALTYADDALSLEEQELLNDTLQKINFSYTQREILRSDLCVPKDAVALFRNITDPKDKERFCSLTHAIIWYEGRMGDTEGAHIQILRQNRHNPQYIQPELAGLPADPPDFRRLL